MGSAESIVSGLDRSPIAAALFARVAWPFGSETPWNPASMPNVARQFAGRIKGRSIDLRDTVIGGIVSSRGAQLATRNGWQFEGVGVDIVNPWDKRE